MPKPTPIPQDQQLEYNSLVITEACAENDFVWTLDYADYVELYNGSDETVNLSDYQLYVNQKHTSMPEMTLAPGEYTVLRCDNKQLGVKLPKEGCQLQLLNAIGECIDQVTLPAMADNQVWLREEGIAYRPSPGFANTAISEATWHQQVHGALVLNEVISGNFRSFSSEAERYTDAVEIYNASKSPVRLSDYYLSDRKKKPFTGQLPDVILPAGQYYVMECTDEAGENTTGFKLSSQGENLYLTYQDGTVSDVLSIPSLPIDVSYGRCNDELMYFDTPTMGTVNRNGHRRMAAQPHFSIASGCYQDTLKVTLSGEGPIYYTLDNSVPTRDSKLYTAPLTIRSDTTVRAVCIRDDKAISPVATAVYSFSYADYTLPVAYVSTQHDYLIGRKDSLYNNYEDTSLEIPAYVAYFEDGQLKFEMDCGLQIHGHTSRNHPKKNYKLRFRSKYGQDSLDYAIFDGVDTTDYDSIVFRIGTHEMMINDVLGAAVGGDNTPELLYQYYKPVNMYLNGEYQGLYYIREHINANFVVNHLGGNEETVDIVYGPSTTEHGSGEDLFALFDYCNKHDLSDPVHYQYVASQLCLDSFIDYYIIRPYTGDTDTPNIRYVRSRDAEDNRWHIVNYDMDWAWYNTEMGLHLYAFHLTQTEKVDNTLINSLLNNAEFRQMYLERLSYHLNVTLAPDRVQDLLTSLNDPLLHDMPMNMERWGFYPTYWAMEIYKIRNYIQSPGYDRRKEIAREAQRVMHLSDAQMQKYFRFLYPHLDQQ